MQLNKIILGLAILATGIMAGIFFTWTNAVTPGIGELTDEMYLHALQSMNRVILNPVFTGLFFAAVVLLPLTLIAKRGSRSRIVVGLLLSATVIYWVGTFGVTVAGNIPLNELLDASPLDRLSELELHNLRLSIETKWNAFNLVRTLTSATAFGLLILASLPRFTRKGKAVGEAV